VTQFQREFAMMFSCIFSRLHHYGGHGGGCCYGEVQVVAEIQRKHKDVSVQALELDLCLVPSILSFVKTIQDLFEGENPPGKLQLLVNNAGILATSQRWTSDEFDWYDTTTLVCLVLSYDAHESKERIEQMSICYFQVAFG
jgi:NAD(P)-dependent dehydrogenase (short-subunit alcohol dehydrogenase family)